MSIIRVKKDTNYSVMNNEFLRREDLSWRAKGILAYLLSRPDDWKVSSVDLARRSKEGRDATKKAYDELKEHGYLKVFPIKGDGEKIIRWDWEVYEKPQSQETTSLKTRNQENPQSGKSASTKYLKEKNNEGTKEGSPSLSFSDREIKKYWIRDIPLLLKTERFTKAWVAWLDHLNEKRKRPTERAVTLQLKKLEELGEEEALLALAISSYRCWKGVYSANSDEKREDAIAFLNHIGIEFKETKAQGKELNGKKIEPEGWKDVFVTLPVSAPMPDSFYDLAGHLQRAVKEKLQPTK